jgi:hypothetical protein
LLFGRRNLLCACAAVYDQKEAEMTLVIDLISWCGTAAIIALFRYAWTHRKRKPEKRKRLPKLDRIGKSRAAEREWQNKPL